MLCCVSEPDLSEEADPGREPDHQGTGRPAALTGGAEDEPQRAERSRPSLLYWYCVWVCFCVCVLGLRLLFVYCVIVMSGRTIEETETD